MHHHAHHIETRLPAFSGPAAMTDPAAIATMTDLRRHIDSTDRAIIALLATRAALIDRAAVLKAGQGLPARIEDRVAQVLANARANADAGGVDPDLAEALWRQIVDWSIAREERAMQRDEIE
jgi:isochorismate pyruvate lyase